MAEPAYIHTHYDVAFLMKDGKVFIGKTAHPRAYIIKHLEGCVSSTKERIEKVIGVKKVEFDTRNTLEITTQTMDAVEASLVT